MALAVWACLRPEPYVLCVALLTAAPLLALVLMATGRGRVVLVQADAAQGQTALTGLFFPPALALGYRALVDIHPLDRGGPLLAAVAIAAVVSLFVILALLRRRKVMLCVGVALTAFAYGWGLAMEGNSLLRPPETQVLRREVASRRELVNKRTISGAATYWVTLSPRHPGLPPEVPVSRELYEATGSELCVLIHHGAFGWRFWEVAACPG